MSGHNKWSQIKRQKEVTDGKKSQIFSRIAKLISVEAKKAGVPNPFDSIPKDPKVNYSPNIAL